MSRTPLAELRGVPLSAREHEVLILIAQGHSNKQIGRQLNVVEATVKTFVRRILAKLGAIDRANAVHIGWQHGYLGETWERP